MNSISGRSGETRTGRPVPLRTPAESRRHLRGPAPNSHRFDADLGEQYEYEVLVFDEERERTLVAAVEIVSPAGREPPEHRQAFVTECAARVLQKGVCVSIVDVVTVRQFNLYGELLESIGRSDPGPRRTTAAPLRGDHPEAALFAATARPRHMVLPAHARSAAFLSPLPLWLNADLAVSLDLEGSYEDACRVLRIILIPRRLLSSLPVAGTAAGYFARSACHFLRHPACSWRCRAR